MAGQLRPCAATSVRKALRLGGCASTADKHRECAYAIVSTSSRFAVWTWPDLTGYGSQGQEPLCASSP